MALDGAFAGLFSPMVLAFFLGVVASLLKSDLRFPDEFYIALSIFLMVAIGIKGGYTLSISPFSHVILPLLAGILLGIVIPIIAYHVLRHLGRFDIANAAAIAAHYGSVSAVTFSQSLVFLDTVGTYYEGFVPSLLVVMEVPAILVAISLARRQLARSHGNPGVPMGKIFRELFAGKSTILLIGFLLIGLAAGAQGWKQTAPLFDAPFKGVLTLFLLEAGVVTGRRIGDLKKVGVFLVGFGILMPIVNSVLGILLGKLAGLSLGGSTVLAILSASASYIAAPAAARSALPEANPTLYLTASLVITFPFNIIMGIPLYYEITRWLYGG